ncbi:MAG TPA: hypothetical protein VH062_02110 [Polyangiaceae bacterium]|nr:hypothetical protein [Polyangiaceae bacterium]
MSSPAWHRGVAAGPDSCAMPAVQNRPQSYWLLAGRAQSVAALAHASAHRPPASACTGGGF